MSVDVLARLFGTDSWINRYCQPRLAGYDVVAFSNAAFSFASYYTSLCRPLLCPLCLRRLLSHHIPLPRAETRHLAAAWYMEIGCIGLEKYENVIELEQFFCSLGARRRDLRRVCGARGRRDGV